MKSFAVIGLGLFGTQIAKDLYEAGYNVLAIDKNSELIEGIADSVTRSVTMDAKNRSALSQLGISKYDCVIVSMSGDLATSVLITMNLKALNVPNIICKVQSETDKEVLETLGASMCIVPEHIAATKLAKKLTGRNIIDFTQLSEDHSIIEMNTPSCWLGQSIAEMKIRSLYGVNIIGVRTNGKIRVNFDPELPLTKENELIIIGSNSNLDKLQKLK